MTIYTAAQTKAYYLFQSDDKRALHNFLEQWRTGIEACDADYVLAVIAEYNALAHCSTQPDRTVGLLVLKHSVQRALWNGKDVDLTMTEFRMVKAMADQVGQFLTYRALYDVVHYVGFVAGCGMAGYRTNVRSMIKRIRRKFMAVEPAWNQIENYNRMGYRWLQTGSPCAEQPMIVTPITGVAATMPSQIEAT